MTTFSILSEKNSYTVWRDGKALQTPASNNYVLPSLALAENIVAEWQALPEDKKIDPKLLPLSQFLATALDVIAKQPEKTVAQITAFAGSDLLCHWAEQPQTLQKLQEKNWQPWLDWCAKNFGARLEVGAGVMPLKQTAATLQALKMAVEKYDSYGLVGLQAAVETTGSLILGLALTEQKIDAAEAFALAEVEHDYQISKWGEDPVSTARREIIKKELIYCERWLRLLKT